MNLQFSCWRACCVIARTMIPFFLIFVFACDDAPAEKRVEPQWNVLFVGNSFTYQNDLPSMLQSLARSGGLEIHVDSVVRGGATLMQHANDGTVLEKLKTRKWDFVVLQEQSQFPAYSQSLQETKKAAQILNRTVQQSKGKVVLFMTWGYRNGDNLNPSDSANRTFEGMQERLRSGYQEIAKEISAPVCPVGLAWLKAKQKDPGARLWTPDGIHPSVSGTYLAACCFYATLLHRSPVGLDFRASLPQSEALKLQSTAAAVCTQK